MRRLAVIDLPGGAQPIYNEQGSVAVVCNGEIYNYLEERRRLRRRGHTFQSRSDVEVIPHSYEDEGVEAVRRWRGMFAVALWDSRRQELILFRDRVGKKPLFYAVRGRMLAFASELPALLTLLEDVPAHSESAIAAYLSLGFVPHPLTIYEGVRCLPPASYLRWRDGEVCLRRYWDVCGSPRSASPRPSLNRIKERLREAVRIRLRSDVPIGVFLSGGIDSGLVAAIAAQEGAPGLMAFTVEVPEARLNEGPAARATAERLGLPVETIHLSVAPADAVESVACLYGQPFGDSSAIPSYFVAREARRFRKVVLTGDGGDEVFAGYRRYWLGRLAESVPPLPGYFSHRIGRLGALVSSFARRRSALGYVGRALRGFGSDELDCYLTWTTDLLTSSGMAEYFPDLAHRGLHALESWRTGNPPKCWSQRAFQIADLQWILADDLVAKIDMATMAHGLEARSPLLDTPLIEYVWSLPGRSLLDYRRTKPLLRELAHEYLPKGIVAAPKRGFEVPIGSWLRGELRELVADTLLAPDGRVASFAAAGAVHHLADGHAGFVGNHAQLVWSLLMLELFLRRPIGIHSAEKRRRS